MFFFLFPMAHYVCAVYAERGIARYYIILYYYFIVFVGSRPKIAQDRRGDDGGNLVVTTKAAASGRERITRISGMHRATISRPTPPPPPRPIAQIPNS